MNSNKNGMTRHVLILKIFIASVLLITWAAGCSSAPSESPDKFVLKYIKKHIPMIDRSVADFYVKEERAGVIDRVQKYIASLKEKGTFESAKKATYDFSKVNINVLDQRDEYINDEEITVIKVAAKGNYTKTIQGKPELLYEDEIIILEAVAGKWRVTEEQNPWK